MCWKPKSRTVATIVSESAISGALLAEINEEPAPFIFGGRGGADLAIGRARR